MVARERFKAIEEFARPFVSNTGLAASAASGQAIPSPVSVK
jgi:hypothetical protein